MCDEKISMSHKCPNKNLLILQTEGEPKIETIDRPPDLDQIASSIEHDLSLNATNHRC